MPRYIVQHYEVVYLQTTRNHTTPETRNTLPVGIPLCLLVLVLVLVGLHVALHLFRRTIHKYKYKAKVECRCKEHILIPQSYGIPTIPGIPLSSLVVCWDSVEVHSSCGQQVYVLPECGLKETPVLLPVE